MIWFVGLITFGLLGYLCITLIIYFNQDSLLYHPTTYPLEELIESGPNHHLTIWPNPSSHYLGLLAQGVNNPSAGTVVVFHGNAGSALGRDFYAQALGPLGYRVLLMEYPGYGAKEGPLGESSLVAAGIDSFDQCLKDFGAPIYILGESMGCGVACAVAAQRSNSIQGLLLITPWDTLPNLAQQTYPAFPTRWLTRDRYDNIEHCRQLTIPIGVVMAQHDTIIPNNRTLNLIQSLPPNYRQWILNAGHNDWFDHTNATWWQDIMTFITAQ